MPVVLIEPVGLCVAGGMDQYAVEKCQSDKFYNRSGRDVVYVTIGLPGREVRRI